MRTEAGRLLALLTAPMLLLGCATPDRVVLLPQPDGSPSAVVVSARGGGQTVLSQPYATALASEGRIETAVSSADEIRSRYKALFDALPARPRSYLVYFEAGSDRLTPESEARLAEIISDIGKLPAPELVIVGHTDTMGSDSVNDEVSLGRAQAIRERLAPVVGGARIETVGRGKREPLIATGDGVADARNRRVEIRMK